MTAGGITIFFVFFLIPVTCTVCVFLTDVTLYFVLLTVIFLIGFLDEFLTGLIGAFVGLPGVFAGSLGPSSGAFLNPCTSNAPSHRPIPAWALL